MGILFDRFKSGFSEGKEARIFSMKNKKSWAMTLVMFVVVLALSMGIGLTLLLFKSFLPKALFLSSEPQMASFSRAMSIALTVILSPIMFIAGFRYVAGRLDPEADVTLFGCFFKALGALKRPLFWILILFFIPPFSFFACLVVPVFVPAIVYGTAGVKKTLKDSLFMFKTFSMEILGFSAYLSLIGIWFVIATMVPAGFLKTMGAAGGIGIGIGFIILLLGLLVVAFVGGGFFLTLASYFYVKLYKKALTIKSDLFS